MNFIKKIKIYLYSRSFPIIHPEYFISCNSEHHGSSYGGYTIYPDRLNDRSNVYSFGIGQDSTFDISLIKKYSVHVFAFDPTPATIDWIKMQMLPECFQFFPFGIANFDGELRLFSPLDPNHISHSIYSCGNTSSITVEVKKLSTILQMLGHNKIDILKMDIEGSEYDVIDDIVTLDAPIKQICIEFHHRFENIGIRKTIEAIEKLYKKGYKIFSYSKNFEELSFIKTT